MATQAVYSSRVPRRPRYTASVILPVWRSVSMSLRLLTIRIAVTRQPTGMDAQMLSGVISWLCRYAVPRTARTPKQMKQARAARPGVAEGPRAAGIGQSGEQADQADQQDGPAADRHQVQ